MREHKINLYSRREGSVQEASFNYEFYRGRRTAECASEISAKLRILKRDVEVRPANAVSIVKCICLFHNIVIHTEKPPEELQRETRVSLECTQT
jgi:hypothetical protein